MSAPNPDSSPEISSIDQLEATFHDGATPPSDWKIGVEYRTTVDQLRKIRDDIEAYVHGNEDFAPADEVSTFVRIDAFSDSSIDIMLYCFTKTTDWGTWLKIKEELAYSLKEIIEGAGSGFAFPSQSVYVESFPGEGPEIFVPPTDTK